MDELFGKSALVTGGGSGVGAAIALALAKAGAAVTIVGRRPEPLRQTASRHERIRWATGDVVDPRAVAAMVAEASAAHGPADIVVANAGAAASKPFVKMNVEDLSAMIDVNLVGVFLVWRAALPAMLSTGWGRLIAVASTAGLKGYAYVTGYCAAKHGVVGLTRALALETATKGVTVNAVCPGYTETPLLERSIAAIAATTGRHRGDVEAALKAANPQGRFIQPDEIASTAVWLCGAGAASVTGQAISISGGEI